MGFWQELQRRRVHRMAGFYVVGAWLAIQVADVFFPAWGLPETALRFLIIAAVLCFPIALVFSWTFDITSGGIVKTAPALAGEDFDKSLKRSDYVVLAALLAVGMAVVVGTAQKIAQEVDDTSAVAEKIENSVAVLPFVNLDTNPDTGYFSDGVTEEILHRLSSLGSLHILGRTSSFAFRNSNDGPARISEILGVRYLLHGSVRRDNNFVRVTARLIDDTGYQVWSETFDRELESIFAIQSEIASTVASRIEQQIVPMAEQPAGRTTTNMEAYNSYLIGRAYMNARTPGWQDRAQTAFEEAIRLDEGYAPPYAGLAVALTVGNNDWEASRAEAIRVAEKAIELDPELAEGHAALGLLLFAGNETDLVGSERSLRKALDLDPSLSIAYNWLASALNRQGRAEESDAVQDQGLIIDPLNPSLSVNIAARYKRRGDIERAEQLVLRLTYLPEPPGLAYWELLTLYFDTGQIDKSLLWSKNTILAYYGSRGSITIATLAWSYERLGMSEDADYWMAETEAETARAVPLFMFKSYMLKIRGDLAGVRAEMDKLESMLGPGVTQLRGFPAAVYAASNILVGNFDVGINLFESAFDFSSLSIIDDLETLDAFEFAHALAYAYQQVGRDDDANSLLIQLHEQLNEFVVEENMDFAPVYELLAHNYGLRGNLDAAAKALENAIRVGWSRRFWVLNDPSWAEIIADPRIARMLDDVQIKLERQRAVVEKGDAEHDFRAEFAALRSIDRIE